MIIHYIGLSKICNLSGLHILRLSEDKISVSTEDAMEMDRMRSIAFLSSFIPVIFSNVLHLNIMFHNIRSLHLQGPGGSVS